MLEGLSGQLEITNAGGDSKKQRDIAVLCISGRRRGKNGEGFTWP